MAHEVVGNMYAGTLSAWHRLGIVDPTLTTVSSGVKAGNMDFTIYKNPLIAIAPDGTQIATDVYGLLREPIAGDDTWATLGTCGKDYDYWQNRDVADRVDLLADQTGWKFSTCGVLTKGKTFFACLDMGATNIAGEQYDQYFTYLEERDGKTRSWAVVSPIRVVCRNTSNLALQKANGKIGIRHGSTYKTDASWIMDMVQEAHQHGSEVAAALNLLQDIAMTDEHMQSVLDAVAPMPVLPTIMTMPNLTGRMKEKRDAAEERYERMTIAMGRVRDKVIANYVSLNDSMSADLRGTGMAAYQAVTEYTTHQHGTLTEGRGRRMNNIGRAEHDLFGIGQDMRNAAYMAIIGK